MILPQLEAPEIILTDPPYGIEFVSNHRKVRYERITGDERLPVDMIEKCIRKASRATYVFCRWDNLSQLPKPRSCLAWVKNNWSMGDLQHEHGRQWEAIAFYAGADHKFISRIPDVIHANRTGNEMHPTEKPVSLLKVILAANVGETVLDPYMGSGSTLVAAKMLGRRCIGIEIEKNYVIWW